MPRLVPKLKAPNFLARAMIPDEIKAQAIEAFNAIAGDISVDQFRDLITLKVSLWQQCMPQQLKDAVTDHAKDYKMFISLANESLIMEWVLEARPDLSGVLGTETGRLWFVKQWNEIMKAIGV